MIIDDIENEIRIALDLPSDFHLEDNMTLESLGADSLDSLSLVLLLERHGILYEEEAIDLLLTVGDIKALVAP